MFLMPLDKAYQPVIPLICCSDQVQSGYNASKFHTGLALRAHGQPYFTHPLDMYQAALDSRLFAYLTDSFKQGFMAITGDAFDLNAEL